MLGVGSSSIIGMLCFIKLGLAKTGSPQKNESGTKLPMGRNRLRKRRKIDPPPRNHRILSMAKVEVLRRIWDYSYGVNKIIVSRVTKAVSEDTSIHSHRDYEWSTGFARNRCIVSTSSWETSGERSIADEVDAMAYGRREFQTRNSKEWGSGDCTSYSKP